MHTQARAFAALAALEVEGVPTLISLRNMAHHHAPIRVVACAPFSNGHAPGGRGLLIFMGPIAATEESYQKCVRAAGSRLIDALLLKDPISAISNWLRVAGRSQSDHDGAPSCPFSPGHALLIWETQGPIQALRWAENTVKATGAILSHLGLGAGYGGRGLVVLSGPLANLEAAQALLEKNAMEDICDSTLIPAPHPQMHVGVFLRAWPLDPCATPR